MSRAAVICAAILSPHLAIDAEKRWITTLGKEWPCRRCTKRSIAHLGYEPDLYVHLRGASRYSLTAAPGS